MIFSSDHSNISINENLNQKQDPTGDIENESRRAKCITSKHLSLK